jgi:catechol 2,3-dioxygenase-like lactoylglutathione lyase family enzyme
MNWTIEKVIPTLAVPDLETGIGFYCRIGFKVDWKWPEKAPTHAGLMLGACSIMLSRGEPAERADVYFIVDDVVACHASVVAGKSWELASAAGAIAKRADCPPDRSLGPPAAPTARGYGLRDFSIVDPWGHHLAFGEVERVEDET